MRAEDSIDTAVGANLVDTWVRKMIQHQKGAIELAQAALSSNTTPSVKGEADARISSARSLVALLEPQKKLSFTKDKESGQAFTRAILTTFEDMTFEPGPDISKTWLQKMSAYDRGAVRLAGVVLSKSNNEKVKSIAKSLADNETAAADRLQKLLSLMN